MISVCIPVFNGEKFLKQAIDSVLNQTYSDFELIILDNNSSDRTPEIISEYDDKRIKYYKNDETLIITDNWSKILDYVTGDYVKYLCADDILFHNCLEKMIEKFEENNDLGMIFCNFNEIDGDNNIITTKKFPSIDKFIPAGRASIKRTIILHDSFGGCPTFVMFKKNAMDMDKRFIHFGENNCYASDLELEIRIMENYETYILGEVYASNRLHKNQQGNKDKDVGITFLVQDLEYMEYILKIYNLKLNYIEKFKFDYRIVKWGVEDSIVRLLKGNYRFFVESMKFIIQKFGILSVSISILRVIFCTIPKKVLKIK